MPVLTAVQQDRAAGVLMAMACGDALGAPHEFGPPLPRSTELSMCGGGPFDWAPGEWTDDTQMAAVLVDAAERAHAGGRRLLDEMDAVARGWAEWSTTAADVGAQTAAVLAAAAAAGPVTAASARASAADLHARTSRTGGNGSLMRTAPVALAYLHDRSARAEAARAISELTHADGDAGDACVLWCAAIAHAVITGSADASVGLDDLPPRSRDLWRDRLAVAESAGCADFTQNGWVVEALQSAWCAISTTPVPSAEPSAHLRAALETAVRGGRDTDTVAAIAGALLGAKWGASAIPGEWAAVVHGWPGMDVATLGARGAGLAA
ncbi:ADP-ribosylglycohydrolase family protein [Cellulomonas chengniuliangii]|uniref:ADP-ribosylglycohydrolase family protein n=1 Tax=Cellulomonas chengniuliangii TaxID=2968084 RepID=UPI001D0E63DC|nr:ADP-ribosylglycohydrolase family protein [Cellulomonas chengniuliangii]MCC2318227.1 ADP-ribosylglycohydrolase family protein [Cellulomonas chengniuliangii]